MILAMKLSPLQSPHTQVFFMTQIITWHIFWWFFSVASSLVYMLQKRREHVWFPVVSLVPKTCIRAKLLQYVWLCDAMDCILPGSSFHGVLQARILEWVAMSLLGDLPDSRIEATPLMTPALAGGFFTTSTTWEALRQYTAGA